MFSFDEFTIDVFVVPGYVQNVKASRDGSGASVLAVSVCNIMVAVLGVKLTISIFFSSS